MTDSVERRSAKRDRAARFYRIVRFLEERGDAGARPDEIADAVGMSRRTVYRDLRQIDEEMGVPVWAEGGRWGVTEKGFLPPLKLTLAEGLAVFLSARLMARYATAHDPDLMGAFQKLGSGMPEALADHVASTLEVMALQVPHDKLKDKYERSSAANGGPDLMIGDADCNGIPYEGCPAAGCDADGDGFPNGNAGCNPGGLPVDCKPAGAGPGAASVTQASQPSASSA